MRTTPQSARLSLSLAGLSCLLGSPEVARADDPTPAPPAAPIEQPVEQLVEQPVEPSPAPLPPLSEVDLAKPPVAAPRDDLVVAAPSSPEPPPAPLPMPLPEPLGLGDCSFFPEPDCVHSLVLELGMGGGETVHYAGTFPYFRAFTELGYLTQVTRDLHLGPVLTAAIATHTIYFDWQFSPRARLRWFVGGTHFVVEHAAGLDYQGFSYHDGYESGTRLGATGDLGFGYRGIVGPFGFLSALADPTGEANWDLRWGAGLRFNLVALATAIGGAFSGRALFL